MGQSKPFADPASLAARCYRLTDKGRACVDIVEAGGQTIGSLSLYLHDLLMLCGTGAWFDQLRQFMPPRTLDESLRTLLQLGLVEPVDDAPPRLERGRARYQSFAQLPA